MCKRILIVLMLVGVGLSVLGQSKRVLFKTDYGDFKVLLYDFTPNHRDLFLRSVKDSVYDQVLFNRVIKDFVVQGGEHDIDIAARERIDSTAKKERLAAEFDDRAFHKVGALGAGRDDNLAKASFLNQIYFVVGKHVTLDVLKELERRRGVEFTDVQKCTYLKEGGLPRLDKDYTIFGEVYEGMDVLKSISEMKADSQDYPLEKVVFSVTLLN